MRSKNVALVIVAVTTTLLVMVLLGSLFTWGGGPFRGGMMGGFGPGMPLLFGGLMMLPILALPVLFILGLAWLLMTQSRGSPMTSLDRPQTPQDILNARYARGEITKEQFEEMRQQIGV